MRGEFFFNQDKNTEYEKNGEKTKPEEDFNPLPVCAVDGWVNDVTPAVCVLHAASGDPDKLGRVLSRLKRHLLADFLITLYKTHRMDAGSDL